MNDLEELDQKTWYWATHPETPNITSNARGRVLHLKKDSEETKTLCNMQITQKVVYFTTRRKCKNCLLISERGDNK